MVALTALLSSLDQKKNLEIMANTPSQHHRTLSVESSKQ